MRCLFVSVLVCFYGLTTLAQLPPTVIGQWRDHLPYSKAKTIAYTGNKVFAASQSAMFYLDLEDNSIQKLSKVNGMSSSGINKIKYEPASNTIVVGYEDGNIDLVSADELEVYNMSDIKRSSLVADKTIYSIYINSGLAYLSLGFGMVVVDVAGKEVKDTYIIGAGGSYLRVNGVTIMGDSIFAATEEGIYKAYKDNPFLSNYASWTKMTNLNGLAVNGPFSNIALFNNKLFVSWDSPVYEQDTVFIYDGNTWTSFSPEYGVDIRSINISANKIGFCHNWNLVTYDTSLAQLENIFDYVDGDPEPSEIEFTPTNIHWVADLNEGLMLSVNTWSSKKFSMEGPYSTGAFKIDISEGNVWIAHGNVYGSVWNSYFLNDFASYKNEEDSWFNFYDDIDENGHGVAIDSTFDIIAVAIDPGDKNHVFLGSMSFAGLIEIRDKKVVAVYDEQNSTLQQKQGWAGFCGISELTFDEDGNLWVGNSFATQPVNVKLKSGGWQSLDHGSSISGRNYREIIVSSKNAYKWVAVPSSSQSGGLFVFDDKGTLTDDSDDQYKLLTTAAGAGNLPSTDVQTVAEDLDGEIWIGTGAGIAVIYSPENVFTGGNYDAQKILLKQDGNYQYLLETEVITAIAIDGANRKWIGTDGSGVFLMSEDGTEELLHFTEENSPLMSNLITDIEIDHRSGEVYFATNKGIVSYRGTATIEDAPYTDVYAYPNPVRPDYDGIIAIKGLLRNSDVKITDIAGNIVFVTKSEGGQAIWNGKNLKGERVKTGVYTVLCHSESGKSRAVAKILFIN